MGWTGHTFVPEDAPRGLREGDLAELGRWCDEQTERFRVVASCAECGRDLIAGETIPHALRHAPDNVRAAAGTVLFLTPAEARETIALVARLLPPE